ncbi:hypothetical protein DMB90_01030 [Raoultella planticola]|uniref:Uncharacterized protein n=1 Tax=Raoultella planticola TaxID=575 RepID=A0A5P6A915_RAOPL|nr:hypothetical protein DMB90_01030 [Raoultella planticola]
MPALKKVSRLSTTPDAVLGQRRAEAGQRCGLAAGSVLLSAGRAENIDTKLANGANYGFPVSTMHIVANKAGLRKPGGGKTV